MRHATVLHISKLDAARRQLEVAIRLYFFDDDPVSIYTLGAASYGVLRDYAVSKGVELQTAEQGILRRVVPGKKRELLAALRKHQNFFKHADKDADKLIDFNPESIEYLLFDGAVAYSQLTAETTPKMAAFNLWWQYRHRDLIKEEFSADRQRLESHSSIFEDGRKKYFARVLPLLQHPNGSSGFRVGHLGSEKARVRPSHHGQSALHQARVVLAALELKILCYQGLDIVEAAQSDPCWRVPGPLPRLA